MKKLSKIKILLLLYCLMILITLNYSCSFDNSERISPLRAIPESSSLLFKFKDLISLSGSLNNEYLWWQSLSKSDIIKQFQDDVELIDSLSKNYPEFKKFSQGKEIYGALNVGGRNEKEYLFSMNFNKSDKEYIVRFIEGYAKEKKIEIKKRRYNKNSIFELYDNKTSRVILSYSFTHSLFIFCFNSLLIEESLRQIELPSIEENGDFASLRKTIDSKADINVFMNHGRANDFVAFYLSDIMKKKSHLLSSDLRWTELDFSFKPDKIMVSGFTKGDEEDGYFYSLLKGQKSGSSEITEIIPSDVPYYSKLYLSDINQFFEESENYNRVNNTLLKRDNQIKEIEKISGINIESLFAELFDKEVAISGIITDQYITEKRNALFLKVKSGSYAYSRMLEFQEAYYKSKKISKSEWNKEFTIDDQSKFNFHKCPVTNIPSLLFGRFFNKGNSSWFSVYDNYLIFADSYETLCKIFVSNVLGETLVSDSEFNKFQSGLTSSNNFCFYCNIPSSIPIADLLFKKDIAEQMRLDTDVKKFKYFSWQVTNSGNLIYNNASLYFNPSIESKSKTIWQSRLPAPSKFKPTFVVNFLDPLNKEIILQDSENNLCLINNVGRIIWQLKLESPILGEIHQIDFFKNGKLQFVFNTAERIYAIDRNGNDVSNFPIMLRSRAANGIALFDYEKNENYRFFVSCEDHNIYAYDQQGNLVEGWELFKTDHLVKNPIQHFKIDGKDYIVASDLMRDYILDRKGNIRVTTDNVYQHSLNNKIYLENRTSSHEPRIVTTDNEGRVHRTYFNGSHEVVEFNKFDDSHFFTALNADQDDEIEYIFSQKNQIYVQDNTGRSLFTQKLEHTIDYTPGVYILSSNDKRIGITCSQANKIYLFKTNGSICDNFPLDGSSEFSIGMINDGSSKYNLLTNSPDGYLYNYHIK